jgi:hypothetical protein
MDEWKAAIKQSAGSIADAGRIHGSAIAALLKINS